MSRRAVHGWVGAGVVALAGAASAGAPPIVNKELLDGVIDGDTRLLVMGDSFGLPRFDRVFTASLLVWPYANITAIGGGCHANGPSKCIIAASPSETVSAAGTYEVLRSTPETAYFALPVRNMEELYLDSDAMLAGAQGVMYGYRLNNTELALGEHGRVTNTGDELRYRPLYWSTPELDMLLADASLLDGNAPRAEVDLRFGARQHWSEGGDPSGGVGVAAKTSQINATAVDIPVMLDMGADPTARVAEGRTPAVGSDTYFDFAGGVMYRVDPATGERLAGTYFTSLADDSWSYFGFGSDQEATGPLTKVFSLEQLTSWLDVTTIDRDQTLVVIYYLALEGGSASLIKSEFEAMIDQTQAAADLVGISSVVHTLVIPHLHKIGNLSVAELIAQFGLVRDVAYELASERPNVAAMSIFDATDEVLFDGSAQAKSWLLDHGYDHFSYGSYTVDLVNGPLGGNLLDAQQVHPANMHAAAFFSSVLADALTCINGDCNDDGSLNLLDFLCFQGAWEDQTAFGDCNGDGTYNVLDFICFQTAFAEGCP